MPGSSARLPCGRRLSGARSSFVEGRKRSIKGLCGGCPRRNSFRNKRADARCEGMIIGELLGVQAGSIRALETVVMIGVALRFTRSSTRLPQPYSGWKTVGQCSTVWTGRQAARLPVVGESSPPDRRKRQMGEVRFSYMKEKPILRGVDLDVRKAVWSPLWARLVAARQLCSS